MQLINIGFGNIVSAERIVSIVSPDSAPIKRINNGFRSYNIISSTARNYCRKSRYWNW